jgi:GMP synthase (glutamine-hydrolysing)
MDANLIYVDAVDRFLDKLAGVESRRPSARSSAPSSSGCSRGARKLEGIEFLSQAPSIPTS